MISMLFLAVGFLLWMSCSSECYGGKYQKRIQLRVEPDFYRNVSQLISSKGYPVEEYKVTTADGYILGLQRIPHGKSKNFIKSKVRPVVFLQHGLLACGSDWVINSANESLGFILADMGYDVWIGNERGTTYSRGHVKYCTSDSAYWKFSFDEMATYDLPAMVEFALDKTNQKQLYYIGHSEGTTVAFAFLSERPDYKPIRAVIALGPVSTVGYITSPIRYLALFTDEIEFVFKLLGIDEFLPNSAVFRFIARILCRGKLDVLCENAFFLFSGFDPAQLNKTRIPVYIAHDPAGTSTQNMIHFAQMVNSRKFQKYDFGRRTNREKYGQDTPPEYVLENIKTPIVLFHSTNDALADPVDVALLELKIKKVLVESYLIKNPLWAHVDFAFGIEARKYVYTELLRVMQKV